LGVTLTIDAGEANQGSVSSLSLSVLLTAAATATTVDSHTIGSRNARVEKQLKDNGLLSVNVAADGNCYFRALSLCLYNHKNGITDLRQSIVQHLAATNANLCVAQNTGSAAQDEV
jgi:hypothetical protein